MNDYVIIAITVIVAVIIVVIAIMQPKRIKQWLLWAVIQAERELGSGTGQLKLRKVYDMFTRQFRFWSIIISFETFSSWVDLALDNMKEMLENDEMKNYIDGE